MRKRVQDSHPAASSAWRRRLCGCSRVDSTPGRCDRTAPTVPTRSPDGHPFPTAATASPAAAAALWSAHRPRNQAIEPARQAPEPTSATQASLPKLATQAATPQPAKQAVAPSFNAYESLLGYALLPDD